MKRSDAKATTSSSNKCLVDDYEYVAGASSGKSGKSGSTRALMEETVAAATVDDEEAIITTGADFADLAKTLEDRRENLMGDGKKQYVRRLGSKSSKAPGVKSSKAPGTASSKGGKATTKPVSFLSCVQCEILLLLLSIPTPCSHACIIQTHYSTLIYLHTEDRS